MSEILVEKNGFYQVVITYFDEANNRKKKWISTGIPTKGSNKNAAKKRMREIIEDFEFPKMNHEKSTTQERSPPPIVREQIVEKIVPDIKDTLFGTYIVNHIEDIKDSIQKTTYVGYKKLSREIAVYFNSRKITLGEIRACDVNEFYNHLLKVGKSKAVCLHYHVLIHRTLNYAYKTDILDRNIADKIIKPKPKKFEGKSYSKEEVQKLFEALKGDPLELLYRMTVFYGLRRSEVCGIKWSNIDFEKNTINICSSVVKVHYKGEVTIVRKDEMKNKTSCRLLPLLEDFANELSVLKEKRFGKNELSEDEKTYVFVNEKTKRVVNPDWVTEHFQQILSRHNLRKIRFHDLRHTCGTLLDEEGVSLKRIQEWLGHSNIATTGNIYVHSNYKNKIGVLDTVSEIMLKK